MVLVDKEIKEHIEKNELIISDFREEDLGSISYDIRVNKILLDEEQRDNYILKPCESIMIECKDIIQTTEKIIGRILEKNSLIRRGILVRGTVIQPEHLTRCYLMVTNLSSVSFEIKENMNIAHVMFEEISDIPNVTYSKNVNSSFVNELWYSGLGRYEKIYKGE